MLYKSIHSRNLRWGSGVIVPSPSPWAIEAAVWRLLVDLFKRQVKLGLGRAEVGL
jgi:hypothetical protein